VNFHASTKIALKACQNQKPKQAKSSPKTPPIFLCWSNRQKQKHRQKKKGRLINGLTSKKFVLYVPKAKAFVSGRYGRFLFSSYNAILSTKSGFLIVVYGFIPFHSIYGVL
jgi:hypothetical protein